MFRTLPVRSKVGLMTAVLCVSVAMTSLSPSAQAADEVTTTVTNNDPPREGAPCFDGTGKWLKFTPGGRGLDQVKAEVGSPGSPVLTYDEFAGSGGFPVFGIDSLVINGAPAYFAEVWVYPGGRLASVFASPVPRLTTNPTVLAPRRGRNITQVFICAVPGPVVNGPCEGGEYLWTQSATTGTRLFVGSTVTINTGVVVPAGSLTVVRYESFDGYLNRSLVTDQPNERWRVVVGSTGTTFTDDILDLVESDTRTGSLPPVVVGAGPVVIEHYSVSTLDTGSPNSVVPVSICFRVD
jgi:hypothetical protein